MFMCTICVLAKGFELFDIFVTLAHVGLPFLCFHLQWFTPLTCILSFLFC